MVLVFTLSRHNRQWSLLIWAGGTIFFVYTLFFVMISILLSSILYTSPQYCVEMGQDLVSAVDQRVISVDQANILHKMCLLRYTHEYLDVEVV